MLGEEEGEPAEKLRVIMAKMTKFVPPAKSVSLSNFLIQATMKKASW